MKDKLPQGICDCGICLDYTIHEFNNFPPYVKCNICHKIPLSHGGFRMKDELKTLKDCYMSDGRNMEQRIREEAIKWIKQDRLYDGDCVCDLKWMKRLNITEDDLKEKKHRTYGTDENLDHLAGIATEEDLKCDKCGLINPHREMYDNNICNDCYWKEIEIEDLE